MFMAKKTTKKTKQKTKSVQKNVQKATQKTAQKLVQKAIKVEGAPISQKDVVLAAVELSGAAMMTEKDNSPYRAAISALEKRTMMTEAKDIDVMSTSRIPVVSINKNALAHRDSGALIFLPESNQELLDDVLVAQKVCENVLLPAVIDLGEEISENVAIPSKQSIEKFISNYVARHAKAGEVLSITNEKSNEQAMEIAMAMGNAKKLIEKLTETWNQKFRRGTGSIEVAGLETAQAVLVVYGQNSRSVKKAMMDLAVAEKPIKLGLIRVHVMRPFPAEAVQAALNAVPANAKIAVMDTTESSGLAGVLCTEIKSLTCRPVSSFVSNKLLSTKNVIDMISKLLQATEPETLWVE